MKYLSLFLLIFSGCATANNFYYEFDKKVELTPKNSIKTFSSTSNNEIKEYTKSDGKTVMFKNEIIVQCIKGNYCEDDFNDLNLTNFEKISDVFYLIKLDENQNIFEYLQKLYEKEDVKSAHPNYISKRVKR